MVPIKIKRTKYDKVEAPNKYKATRTITNVRVVFIDLANV